MRTYTQLPQEQRYQIYALKRMGHQQTEIANYIGVDKSTISRELKRNQGQHGYRPKQAHTLAKSRRKRTVQDQIRNLGADRSQNPHGMEPRPDLGLVAETL